MGRPVPMDLTEAVRQFIEYRTGVQRRAETTIIRERTTLRAFVRIIEKGHTSPTGTVNIHSLTTKHLDAWRAQRNQATGRQGMPLSAAYLNTEIQTLRTFFQWAARSIGFKGDPLGHLDPLKTVEVDHLRIPPERFAEFLDAADSPVSRWLAAVGLYTMARAGEIRSMTHARLAPLPDGSPGIWIRRTKNGTLDHIPMVLELQEEYDRWMSYYRKHLARQGIFSIEPDFALVPAYKFGGDHRPGIPKWFNVYQSPARADRLVNRIFEKMGYDTTQTGMHTLRRSAARAWYNDLHDRQVAGEVLPDTPIRMVMALLGHAKQSTTEIYIGLAVSRAARDSVMIGRRMFEHRTGPATPAVAPVARLHSVGESS